jgi:hypothetical protein
MDSGGFVFPSLIGNLDRVSLPPISILTQNTSPSPPPDRFPLSCAFFPVTACDLVSSEHSPDPTGASFWEAIQDRSLQFNPSDLRFVPHTLGADGVLTFGELVRSFFFQKNSARCRFIHKLFIALKMSTICPSLKSSIGVEWLTSSIIRVDKFAFARLLGIKTVDGSFFHQQGNFPSHGFVELNECEAKQLCSLEQLKGVDFDSVRLLRHAAGVFTQLCTGDDIQRCRWVSAKRRNR